MTLTDIQQSFYARSFDAESIRWWLAGLGAVVLCLLAFHVAKTLRARKVKYSPYGCIADPKMIRNIIRSAYDQRRPFEVQIQTEPDRRRPFLRCAPEHFSSDSLTFEVSGLKSLSDNWLDRPVTVFFRILVEKELTYYTFLSRITGITLPAPDICQITLPLPTGLENRQKRSFLRITPPLEFFPGAAIWYGDHFPKTEAISDIAVWPRPRLFFIPERMEQFSLIDLSAGGARICVPGQVIKNCQLQFNAAQYLILMLDLFDPEQKKRFRYWLECRVQNVRTEYGNHDVHLGVQFLSWARAREIAEPGAHAAYIEWLKLSSSNEVEPVGNWIMHRHLEMFRNPSPEFL